MAKKVVILSRYFPPFPAVGGYRIEGWKKHFYKSDLYPVVITYNWNKSPESENDYHKLLSQGTEAVVSEDFLLMRTPLQYNKRDHLLYSNPNKHRFRRKLLSVIMELKNWGSPKGNEHIPLFREADKYISENGADLIIASGEPFSLFRLAAELSKKHNIPWVADYRDGWSTNSDVRFLPFPSRWFMENVVSRIERHIVNSASLISVVSEPRENEMRKLFPKTPFAVIPNGYDGEKMSGITPSEKSSEILQIAHAGAIYPFQRLDVFIRGFRKFKAQNRDARVEVVFYGLNNDAVPRLKKLSDDLNEIRTEPTLPQKEVWRKLKSSHVLLLLAGKKVDGYCTKSYEYLALSRCVLLSVNDHGTLEKLMQESDAGHICENSEDVKLTLEKLYREFTETGDVSQETKNYQKFEKSKLASSFAEHLKKIC